jgi:glycerol-3-phosphate dehydrogenase
MTFVTTLFPTQKIKHDDVISTHSGIRSVLDTCKEDPCKESREHIIWNENNLVTVTGGKLTTFRFMALEALKLISKNLTPSFPEKLEEGLFHCESPERENYKFHELVPEVRKRLIGRFGNSAGDLVNKAGNGELEPIPGTTFLWAELRYAARMEGAIHLSDLLLRRTRIGITSPLGGLLFLGKIKHIVQAEMKWSESRWAEELSSYRDLWHSKYQTPQ